MTCEPADSLYGNLTTKEREEHEHVLNGGGDAHYEALLNQLFADLDENVDDDVVLKNFKKFQTERPRVDLCFAARKLGLAATCEALLENLTVLQYEIDSLEWRKQAFKEALFASPQEVNLYRVFDKRARLHEAHAARASLVVRWLAKQEKDYLRIETELSVGELCRACKDFSLAMPNKAIARAEFELGHDRSFNRSSKTYSWIIERNSKIVEQYQIFEDAIKSIEQTAPRYRFQASLPPSKRTSTWWLNPKDEPPPENAPSIPEAATKEKRTAHRRLAQAPGDVVREIVTPDGGWFSCKKLAAKYKVGQEALRKVLEHLRKTSSNGWIEVSNKGKNEPKFLYQPSTVEPLAKKLRLRELSRSGQRTR